MLSVAIILLLVSKQTNPSFSLRPAALNIIYLFSVRLAHRVGQLRLPARRRSGLFGASSFLFCSIVFDARLCRPGLHNDGQTLLPGHHVRFVHDQTLPAGVHHPAVCPANGRL